MGDVKVDAAVNAARLAEVAQAAAQKSRFVADVVRPKNAVVYFGVRKRQDEYDSEMPRYHQLIEMADDILQQIVAKPGAKFADFPRPTLPPMGEGKSNKDRFGAGVIKSPAEQQAEVRKLGLFYPPDPASLKECSIGGNIATNAGGPRCLKYGVTRSYVLGLEVVLANGRVLRCGGRTHKNKQGFDLVGMFTGSEGLLGVVTEATLRLLPHPPARATLAASFRTFRQAAAAVQAIFAAGFLPSALEIADPFTLKSAREFLGREIAPGAKSLVLVELDGQAGSVKGECAALAKLLRKIEVIRVLTALGDEECEKLWGLRRAYSQSLKARDSPS